MVVPWNGIATLSLLLLSDRIAHVSFQHEQCCTFHCSRVRVIFDNHFGEKWPALPWPFKIKITPIIRF